MSRTNKILAREIAHGRTFLELELPIAAIQLLYDVLGHFPHDHDSWSGDARRELSAALDEAHSLREP